MTAPEQQDEQETFTASHTYPQEATGDHLVRVVSPAGVFAEFIGTPGASLAIRMPKGQPHIPLNDKGRLQAWVEYEDPDMDARQVTARAEWKSSNPSVATVGTGTGGIKGVVTGRKKGKTVISAMFGGLRAKRTVQVREAAPDSLSVESVTGETTVRKGAELPLRSTVTFTDGDTEAVTDDTDWSTEDESVAVVSNSGRVTGKSAGTATITGRYTPEGGDELMAKLKVTVEAEFDQSGSEEEETPELPTPEEPEDEPGDEDGNPEIPENNNGGPTDEQGNGANDGSGDADQGNGSDGSESDSEQGGGAAEDPTQGGAPADGGVQPQQ